MKVYDLAKILFEELSRDHHSLIDVGEFNPDIDSSEISKKVGIYDAVMRSLRRLSPRVRNNNIDDIWTLFYIKNNKSYFLGTFDNKSIFKKNIDKNNELPAIIHEKSVNQNLWIAYCDFTGDNYFKAIKKTHDSFSKNPIQV